MDHAELFLGYVYSKNRNRSGSISVQIAKKVNRSNKVIKIIGIAKTKREEELLMMLAKTEMDRITGMHTLFVEHDYLIVENSVDSIANDHLQIVGSELILGKINEKIGFPDDG